MEKYKNWMIVQLLDDNKASKGVNMVEIVFLRGISEIQCLILQQNSVNPGKICNDTIQLNIVFHTMISFLGNINKFTSASDN